MKHKALGNETSLNGLDAATNDQLEGVAMYMWRACQWAGLALYLIAF